MRGRAPAPCTVSRAQALDRKRAAARSAEAAALRAAVPSVRIANGWPDVMMPTVALGSWAGSLRNGTVAAAVDAWLKAGGRHVDSAHGYATEAVDPWATPPPHPTTSPHLLTP